jgi:hypothetical protein
MDSGPYSRGGILNRGDLKIVKELSAEREPTMSNAVRFRSDTYEAITSEKPNSSRTYLMPINSTRLQTKLFFEFQSVRSILVVFK